ncbi:hypothetical protein SAMN05421788_110196 [Filimonas lacunae]|uniref:Uncharacterized protein n=1 Tax=Filimonas lacunae TaxID=477680 RepID=A0A1N7R8R9_9BACT|nr:hypothetical protein [Filimonas lacunae]SIT31492.1 hypothetical protein SAMN05421788_110196 [Filimonas lacunae]
MNIKSNRSVLWLMVFFLGIGCKKEHAAITMPAEPQIQKGYLSSVTYKRLLKMGVRYDSNYISLDTLGRYVRVLVWRSIIDSLSSITYREQSVDPIARRVYQLGFHEYREIESGVIMPFFDFSWNDIKLVIRVYTNSMGTIFDFEYSPRDASLFF